LTSKISSLSILNELVNQINSMKISEVY